MQQLAASGKTFLALTWLRCLSCLKLSLSCLKYHFRQLSQLSQVKARSVFLDGLRFGPAVIVYWNELFKDKKHSWCLCTIVSVSECRPLILTHSVIRFDRYSSLRCSNELVVANGWELNCCWSLANDLSMFALLVHAFQTLNTVENGIAYISHILSRKNMEDGDLMSISESWRSECSSEGKWSQSLKIDDKMVETISVWLYLKDLST